MKTADLIASLARDAAPVRPVASGRQLAGVTVVGSLIALAFLVAWLGMRPMTVAVHQPSFWMKASYTAALALGGWGLTARLSRPGGSPGRAVLAVAAVLLVMLTLAAAEMMATPGLDMRRVWLGGSWNVCPFRIVALAVPIFVLAVLAVRRLAPTRLALAGAACGLLAGAAAATVYGLACEETSAAFTATWYTLGIAACAGAGALLGPRLLRW